MVNYYAYLDRIYTEPTERSTIETEVNHFLGTRFPGSKIDHISEYTEVMHISTSERHNPGELENALTEEFEFIQRVEETGKVSLLTSHSSDS